MKDMKTNIRSKFFGLALLAAMLPLCAHSQTLRGDFNMDGEVNVTDAVSMINCLLKGSPGEVPPSDRDTLTVSGIPVVMVRVKAGTYTLQYGDVRTVESDFWIGQTEVTYELWWEVMGRENYPSNEMLRHHAMQNVSWDECQVFLDSLNRMTGRNFRLPYADEWMFAASGGKLAIGYDYSGSSDIDEVAWYSENSGYINGGISNDVATKAPNELGLYDMSGNVAEWVQEMKEYQTDNGVVRTAWVYGGHCVSPAENCRPTSWILKDPSTKYGDPCGLRLALPVAE
ncbi:MAG: SUMF1/EgtB/PvdO family nonheme iron enzyme [Muribaculaceae bacterium]|nr:SUMF1/EgtB/PvdO family nonheme iron enzyme [Muribaculaceae bacterium]